MRGLGDFQRAQMRERDPRINDLFNHIRQAVDILGQLMLRPHTIPPNEEARPKETEKHVINATEPSQSTKLAYAVKEVRRLVGISRSTLYIAIGANELRAVKHGRKTMILAKDLQAWLDKLQPMNRAKNAS